MKASIRVLSVFLSFSALAAVGSDAAETPTVPAAAKCRVPERFRCHPLFTTRHCGVNFGFLARYGYFADPQVFAQCAKIKEAGANWVTLNTHFCQEAFYSTRLFLDFDWSSGEAELEAIVAELHRQGLHVLLKPCLTSLDSAWMGEVRFPGEGQEQISGLRTKYWHDWFESFRRCLTYYCRFAERTGCEAMIVGAEYHGTIGQNDEWLKTLEHVRKHYSGPITYEVMPYEIVDGVYNTWMEKLDFLGVSTYPSASPKGPARDDRKLWPKAERVPLEEMKKTLAEECKPLKDALDRYFPGMPVVFTEIGTRSARGVVNQPWDYLADSLWDGQEQADYMEAVFQTFSGDPRWLGLSWWKWDETQKTRPHYDPDPKKDRGFTIYGKPAAEVMKKWSKQMLY